jgi:archaemetzincin
LKKSVQRKAHTITLYLIGISTIKYIPKNYRKFSILIVFLILVESINAKTCYTKNIEMENKICVIPIGSIEKHILYCTQEELEKRFKAQVYVGKELEYPDYAYSKTRKQYHSTRILKRIHNLRLSGYDRMLGIADVDLFVPELTFVFGEADIRKKVALISLTRLRQEFYSLPEDIALFNKRVIIEAVHELGHTYGLRHCANRNCVMFFSNTLYDTDRKGSGFCDICANNINNE